ncbi:MAG: RNA chaperone Hfq [Eubacteriales bacterium]|nr:RNA chaperone Hfq [Eubacteriales bacterium]MDD4540906.1 RNA chaperone Hfq [Eubacteriales bacterium]
MTYLEVEENVKRNQNISQSGKIQEAFLNHCRRQKVTARIQLADQTVMEGIIVGFDQDTIVVNADSTQQLIFKSAIVCIRSYEVTDLIFNDNYRKKKNYAYPRVYNSSWS